MDNTVIGQLHHTFEDHAHAEGNVEFWYARDLQVLLDYDKWENFAHALGKARIACLNAGYEIADHFPDVRKMVDLGSGAKRQIADLKRKLPRQVNHNALKTILEYLEQNNRIAVTLRGITWTSKESAVLKRALNITYSYPEDFAEKNQQRI